MSTDYKDSNSKIMSNIAKLLSEGYQLDEQIPDMGQREEPSSSFNDEDFPTSDDLETAAQDLTEEDDEVENAELLTLSDTSNWGDLQGKSFHDEEHGIYFGDGYIEIYSVETQKVLFTIDGSAIEEA